MPFFEKAHLSEEELMSWLWLRLMLDGDRIFRIPEGTTERISIEYLPATNTFGLFTLPSDYRNDTAKSEDRNVEQILCRIQQELAPIDALFSNETEADGKSADTYAAFEIPGFANEKIRAIHLSEKGLLDWLLRSLAEDASQYFSLPDNTAIYYGIKHFAADNTLAMLAVSAENIELLKGSETVP